MTGFRLRRRWRAAVAALFAAGVAAGVELIWLEPRILASNAVSRQQALSSHNCNVIRVTNSDFECATCASAARDRETLVQVAKRHPAALVRFLDDEDPTWWRIYVGVNTVAHEPTRTFVGRILLEVYGDGALTPYDCLLVAGEGHGFPPPPEAKSHWESFVARWHSYASGQGPLPRGSSSR